MRDLGKHQQNPLRYIGRYRKQQPLDDKNERQGSKEIRHVTTLALDHSTATDRASRGRVAKRLSVARSRGFVGIRFASHFLANHPLDRKSTRLNSSHVAISYA